MSLPVIQLGGEGKDAAEMSASMELYDGTDLMELNLLEDTPATGHRGGADGTGRGTADSMSLFGSGGSGGDDASAAFADPTKALFNATLLKLQTLNLAAEETEEYNFDDGCDGDATSHTLHNPLTLGGGAKVGRRKSMNVAEALSDDEFFGSVDDDNNADDDDENENETSVKVAAALLRRSFGAADEEDADAEEYIKNDQYGVEGGELDEAGFGDFVSNGATDDSPSRDLAAWETKLAAE